MKYDEMKEKMEKLGWVLPLDKLDLGKNYGIFLKIGIVSTTTGYLINRNNEPTEVTSEEFYNENRVVIPASKWRGAERSLILSILRKAELVDKDYYRNMVKKKSELINPASLLWGDSSTGGGNEAAGIASRSFYDWAYSFEPVSRIVLNLTHNTIGDDGSILKEDINSSKVASNAIYNANYIIPGVKFIRFITLENVSFELLLLQLMATSRTTRYGARTAILGDNINNQIVAIGGSKGDKPITSYTLMTTAWETPENRYNPQEMILKNMDENYAHVIKENELDELLAIARSLINEPQELKKIYEAVNEKMREDWKELFGKSKKNKVTGVTDESI